MKQFVFFLFVAFAIVACQEESLPTLEGKWIEKGNFINPFTIKFAPDYMQTNSPFNNGERLYKVKGDSLILQGDHEIIKFRIEFVDDELHLLPPDSADLFELQ